MQKRALLRNLIPSRIKAIDPRVTIVVFLLVLGIVVTYWQTIDHKFVTYDDGGYIYENPPVLTGLTWEGILWAFTTGYQANWHPLTWLSHMVDAELYGLNAGGHHITSMLIHTLSTILLFFVFRRMTGSLWPSAFVAAFFGLHPLHVESVAWASERKDVLSALFWMATMLAYVRYVEAPSTRRYVLALLLFALGLMAKPMLVTLPFVLLLLDYWPLKRLRVWENQNSHAESSHTNIDSLPFGKIVVEKIPFFILTALSSIVTFLVQQRGGAVFPLEVMPVSLRLQNTAVSYVSYIRKMIWPSDLATFYPHPGFRLPLWEAIAATVFLLLVTVCVVWWGKKHRYLTTGWLWYIGTLVPVIGIVQVGIQAMADRYTYLPLIGLSVVIAWGVNDLAGSWRLKKVLLSFLGGLSVLAMVVLTWFQVGTWRDSTTLFSHAADVIEENYLAMTNLGLAKIHEGKFDEAIDHLTEAQKIAPLIPDIHNYLGLALSGQGKFLEATEKYKDAVRLRPKYQAALFNLAVAYDRLGNTDEAISYFEESLLLNPEDAEAHNNLGAALGKLGNIDAAVDHFREAVRIRPEYTSALYNLGTGLITLGRHAEAVTPLSDVIRLKPDHAKAHYNLGLALEEVARYPDALLNFQEALRLDSTFAQAREGWVRMVFREMEVKKKTIQDSLHR